jgi:hypothetical protein
MKNRMAHQLHNNRTRSHRQGSNISILALLLVTTGLLPACAESMTEAEMDELMGQEDEHDDDNDDNDDDKSGDRDKEKSDDDNDDDDDDDDRDGKDRDDEKNERDDNDDDDKSDERKDDDDDNDDDDDDDDRDGKDRDDEKNERDDNDDDDKSDERKDDDDNDDDSRDERSAEEIAAADEAADHFYETVEAARADRVSDNPVGTTSAPTSTLFQEWDSAGDQLTEYREDAITRTARLEKLVMADNSIGKVFPGSLLWAAPIRQGRLEQLRQIPGRPPTAVSFTEVYDGGEDNAGVIEHNGTFSDFTGKAADAFANARASGGSLDATIQVSSSLEDAMLSVGLSAQYWGVRLSSGLDVSSSSRRSFAILSLDQTFFSAAVDAPPLGGYLPEKLVRSDVALAQELERGAETGGEVAYVRKVDYGRRVLVVLSSDAYSDELKAALDVSVNYAMGSGSFSLDAKTRSVWEASEGRLLVVGGSVPQGVDELFSGSGESFVNSIRAIMSQEFIDNAEGAVPVSFEVAYESDDAPMQVFETADFAGKIPVRTWGYQHISQDVITGGTEARVVNGDAEVHSDDWTMVSIDDQDLNIVGDRDLEFRLKWTTHEGNRNKGLDSGASVIENALIVPIRLSGNINRDYFTPFNPPVVERWYSGVNLQRTSLDPGNPSLLKNVVVQFDGNGDDQKNQFFSAKLEFDVLIQQ